MTSTLPGGSATAPATGGAPRLDRESRLVLDHGAEVPVFDLAG